LNFVICAILGWRFSKTSINYQSMEVSSAAGSDPQSWAYG